MLYLYKNKAQIIYLGFLYECKNPNGFEMNISPISFGKKTPIMKSNIRDVLQNKSAEVTLSEYDCKDIDDIKEVSKKCGDWTYGGNIAKDMDKKRESYLGGGEKFPTHFYVVEDKHKNIIGLCETIDIGKDTNVEFLESDREAGYKYVGQTMLLAAGKKLLDRGGENLCVAHPYIGALSFYTDKCGFESIDDDNHCFSLFMDKSHIREYIDRIQRKTNSADIKG